MMKASMGKLITPAKEEAETEELPKEVINSNNIICSNKQKRSRMSSAIAAAIKATTPTSAASG